MRATYIVISIVLMLSTIVAQNQKRSSLTKQYFNPALPSDVQYVSWEKHARQGYSMKMWLSNSLTMGEQAWSPLNVPQDSCSNPGLGLVYPAGSCIEHLFGAGPIIGGIINGVRRVSVGYNGDDASMEFLPERKDSLRDRFWHTHVGDEELDSTGNGYSGYYYVHDIRVNQRFVDDDGDGRIDEDELDGQDNDGDWNILTDDLGGDGLPDQMEVSCDGEVFDANTNPDPAYDNYEVDSLDKCRLDANGNYLRMNVRDRYTQNNGIPDHGEPHVDEDYGAVSDNDLSVASTDTFVSYTVSGHFPMGIKVFMKSYAWQGDYGEAILPFDYYFVNVGRNIIHNVYLGMFTDADIGPVNITDYFQHNYSCYIPELWTSYTANAQDRGSTPLGLTLLGAQRSLDSLSFVFQWHGFGDPGTNDSNIYSWMSGEHWGFDVSQFIRTCQSPSSPTDVRYFFSFGPFGTMFPGDTVKASFAWVSGDGVDEGANTMRTNAASVLQKYRRNYIKPPVPPSPPLHVTRDGNKVFLDWKWKPGDPGIDPLESWDENSPLLADLPDTDWRKVNPPPGKSKGGRNFEGFKVWRSESPSYNPKTFALLAKYAIDPDPVTSYTSGLAYAFVDTNLRRGKTYWYAVTSYSMPDGLIQRRSGSFGYPVTDTILGKPEESNLLENATRMELTLGPSKKLGDVKVVPNPYRGDVYYTNGNGFEGNEIDWTDDRRVIWFIDLPPRVTIRVYSLDGAVITTLHHDDALRSASGLPVGQEEWRLFSESERPIASGIYVFSVDSEFGQQVGKFVVIK